MADWTNTDLANNTLEHIGVKPAGNSASSEDLNRVDTMWVDLHDRLDKLGYIDFDYDAIPDGFKSLLMKILGEEISTSFGITGSHRAEIREDARMAMANLREQTKGGPRYIPVVFRDY
jgi:hypothetical protein